MSYLLKFYENMKKISFWGQGRGEWEDGFLKVILEEYTSHLQKFNLRTVSLEVVNTLDSLC